MIAPTWEYRVSLLGCVVACSSFSFGQDSDNTSASKAAIIGYASNVQDFPFYRVKYRTTKAEAETTAEALGGKWRQGAFVDTLYILDGNSERLERDAGPLAFPKIPPGGTPPRYVSAPFSSEQYIAGDPGSASYVQGLRAINIFRRQDGDLGMATSTPLSMGLMGHRNKVLGPDILEADRERFDREYLGNRIIDGMNLIGVRFTRREPVERFEFWFDPARGYLPARIYATTVKKRVITTHLVSAKQCSRGRWFPDDVITMGPASDKPIRITQLKVLELDVDTRPKAEDFFIKVPAGTQVLWRYNSAHYRLKQDETIYAKDLDAFFEMSERAVREPLADTAVPAASGWNLKTWAGIGLGVLLIIGGGVSALRKWRRPSPV